MRLTVVMDLAAASWHSRSMATRYSFRRLVAAILLSQAMVLQTLLVSWVGTTAFAGQFAGGWGSICSGLSEGRGGGGTELPARPDTHRDCLDACLTCHGIGKLPDEILLRPSVIASAWVPVPIETALLETSGPRAFLPRGPPALT